MKIGFLTACLRNVPLADLMKWAGENGFGALEVWAGAPEDSDAPTVGACINARRLDAAAAESLRRAAEEAHVEISCLTWCVNQLDPDPERRQANRDGLIRILGAAALLDVDVVSCFVGRNHQKTVEGSLEDFREVFSPIMDAAADKGVRIAIENWPGIGWGAKPPLGDEHAPGNIAYSPPIWRRMFEIFPEIGLNYDPSHLVWQGIDYLKPVAEFGKHIYHVHAKDTEVLEAVLADRGILPPAKPRWWRYRAPGFGVVEWPRFVSALAEVGYDGPLSIEHEDPVFSGDEDRVKRGLLLGRNTLAPLV